ncbi:MAG: GAF domain-containing protein [Acidobacteria bacterium]|nr:GAF domain-containing protein [Acidobacteriota bacterium]
MVKAIQSYPTGMFEFDGTTQSDLMQMAQRLSPHETALRQHLFERLTTTVGLPARLAETAKEMMASLLRAFFRHIPQGQFNAFLDQVKALAWDVNRSGLPFKTFVTWFYLFETSSRPLIEQEMPDAAERMRAIVSLSQLLHAASATFAQATLEEKHRLMEAQVHPLHARNRILATLATEWQIPTVCARVVDELRQLVSCDRVSITLQDETSGKLQEYAVEAPGHLSVTAEARPSIHRLLRPTTEEPAPSERESVLTIPLTLRNETIGMLRLTKCEPETFVQDQVELAHFVARHLAQAVERTRVSTRRWFRPEQSEALRQIALVTSGLEPVEQVLQRTITALAQMLGADASAIFFFDKQWATQFGPIGSGLNEDQMHELQEALPKLPATTEALSTKMLVSISDTALDARIPKVYAHRFDIKSAVMAPLVIKDVPVGVLLLIYTGVTRTFDQEELSLARQVAQLIAVVAENGLLLEWAQGEAEKSSILFRASHDAVYLVNALSGLILDVNSRAEEMAGYSRQELLNKRMDDLYPEEERAQQVSRWQSALEDMSTITMSDVHLVRKDGSRIGVHYHGQGLAVNGKKCVLISVREAIPAMEPQEYMIQAERTEALEQLALAMRHEINNPLTGILGNIQLLLLTRDLPEDLQQRLETIEGLTLRIRDIMRRLEMVKDQTIHYLDERKMIDLRGESTPKAEAHRVLVVDDEPSIVSLLTTILTKEGFEVEGVSDGATALKEIESGKFDHVLLDVKIPDMDAPQIYQRLQESRLDMTDKIIFITGDASAPETLDFILRTGNKYLKKPFSLQEIKTVLIPFLKNYAP